MVPSKGGLPAGLLRERITLEQPTVIRDALGGESRTWACRAMVWASIDSPSGREANVAQQMSAVISHVVVIRPRDDISATWRIRWGARVLSVEAVLPAAQKDRTTLLCSEGLNQGDL